MKYIYSKLRWRLAIYNFSQTWIEQHLDDKIIAHVKNWLHFHQGASLSHLKLAINKFGFGFQLPSDVYRYCRLSLRRILFRSINKDMRCLFSLTKYNNNNVIDHLSTLKEQYTIMRHTRQVTLKKYIAMWDNICSQMPKNIFVFVRRALIFSLPNNSNLCRWGKRDNPLCDLYATSKQTQLHMLSACPVAAENGRYTWRHDSILFTLLHYICQLSEYGFQIYADLVGHEIPNGLFNSFGPDVVLVRGSTIYILELTCCFETNSERSREFKIDKYKEIKNDCKKTFQVWKKIFIEVTTLGLVTKHIGDLYYIFKDTDINYTRMLEKCMEAAMRASFYIYVSRNKQWTSPPILKFY